VFIVYKNSHFSGAENLLRLPALWITFLARISDQLIMARPVKLIKKRKQFNVRCTLAESLFIKELADKHGQSISEYARAKLLEERVKPKMTEEEINRYDQLVSMANDLKKLSDHADDLPQFQTEIINTLEEMNRIIRRL